MTVVTLPVADSLSSVTLIGGKAVNLNHLLTAGFAVPPSIVVTTEAYWAFVTANKLDVFFQARTGTPVSDETVWQHFLAASLPGALSDSILNAYHNLGNKLVAVRSSATAEDWEAASFAGQHDSFLNVQGETAVLEAVKKCWASLWMERAVVYRNQRGIDQHQVSMAVIIQPMIAATCSGVLFTQDPLTLTQKTVVVEAVPGLGQDLVSGRATPDRYVVNRHNKEIEKTTTQREPPVLTNAQVQQLVVIGLAVAELFGAAQDIEWAVENNSFFLLQSRAITTKAPSIPLTPLPPHEINVPGDDSWLPEEAISHPFDLWTRANFGEVLPNPVTPLTLSSLQMIGNAAEVQLASGKKVQMARRIYGRIYANEGGMRQFVADIGLPTSFIDATWGSRRPDLPPKAGFRPWRLLTKGPQLIWQGLKSQRQPSSSKPLLPRDEAELYRQIDVWTDEFQQRDLSGMSEEEVWSTIRTVWEPRRAEVYQRHVTVSTGAFLSFAPLEWMTKKWGHDARLAQTLITGLDGVYAAEMGPALQRLAQALHDANLVHVVRENPPQAAWDKLQTLPEATGVRALLKQFLHDHGHRCPAEPEILLPRWVEAPEQVIALVAGYVGDIGQRDKQEHSSAQVAQQNMEKQLGLIRRVLFRRVLQQAQNQVRRRDNSRHFMAKLELSRRQLFMELGRRWHERGILSVAEDIFFLTHDEIDIAVRGSTTATAESLLERTAERRKAYEFWCSYPIPEALDAESRPLPNLALSAEQGLQGIPASGGMATGPVRIVHQPNEAARLQRGDILVTLATDPGWTPVFPLVAGLVLVYGGQLSHGAIVAREYGVPAVVNVPEAMTRLHEGMIVTVDGSNGRVLFLAT
ncbi:MAG: hypothetical protein IPM39_27135 [Chloroflexi bacterium]|nr:hypothetical protein [Chloroflexota bacterium]